MILNSSRTIQYETSGVIKTTNQNTDLASRIKIILLGLEEVINQFKPDCVAIEKVFVNTNQEKATMMLSNMQKNMKSFDVEMTLI